MKSFEKKLPAASEGWVHDGLISSAQRTQILLRHPDIEHESNRFVAVIATIGATMLALGVILLISSNWQDIGDWTKIGGMLILVAATFTLGWRGKVAPGNYPKIGDALLMLGCVLYLGGIALVSQVFHLNSRPATGALIWLASILPVPWLTRSKGAQFMCLVALLAWLGMEFNTAGGPLELIVPLYNFWDSDSGAKLLAWTAAFGLLGMFIVLTGFGLRKSPLALFAGLHELWGGLTLCTALYFIGFARDIAEGGKGITLNFVPLLLVTALVGASGFWAWYSWRPKLKVLGPPFLGLLGIFGGVFWFVSSYNDKGGLTLSIVAWVALFLLNILMIRAGLETGQKRWVNMGIAFIGINLLTRYFDMFDSMLGSGMFFIISGVVVITVGVFLEKKRRSLLAKLRAKEAV